MIIIRIQGGLGNQLFQYALYEAFKVEGKEVRADITAYRKGWEKRPFELEKLGLKVVEADEDEIHFFYADNQRILDRFMRYTFGKKLYHKEKTYDYDCNILEIKEGYLNGYWQSEKYFRSITEKIRQRINFKEVNSDSLILRKHQMQNENSVSIHVRMGDYTQLQKLYGGICTKEYYGKAIRYIVKRIGNPVFYVFSDEPEKASELLEDYEFRLITENFGNNSYKDMYLMSCCKHHIISNSTFSWWGAWLDPEPDKIVITPYKWNNCCRTNEICCDGWIAI